MIKEAYVSFEIAKLLKENGFNEYCWKLYELGDLNKPILLNGFELDSDSKFWNNKYLELYKKEHSYINDICSVPTHQLAMAWLREKNISIELSVVRSHYWVYTIYEILNNKVKELYNDGDFDSYEDAIEAALKYYLENLFDYGSTKEDLYSCERRQST